MKDVQTFTQKIGKHFERNKDDLKKEEKYTMFIHLEAQYAKMAVLSKLMGRSTQSSSKSQQGFFLCAWKLIKPILNIMGHEERQ